MPVRFRGPFPRRRGIVMPGLPTPAPNANIPDSKRIATPLLRGRYAGNQARLHLGRVPRHRHFHAIQRQPNQGKRSYPQFAPNPLPNGDSWSGKSRGVDKPGISRRISPVFPDVIPTLSWHQNLRKMPVSDGCRNSAACFPFIVGGSSPKLEEVSPFPRPIPLRLLFPK
jgi:hypothetical protein